MTAVGAKRYREKHADKIRAQMATWRANNKIKIKAHKLVRLAMKDGALKAPENCQKCGDTKKLEAHHEDYLKPLDVMWLCHRCHGIQHGRVLTHDIVFVGESHVNSKLTEAKVIDIRRLFSDGWSKRGLARHYGVSESNVRQIIARQKWNHI